MKIIVDMNHPAHVHFFKNFILEMEKRGHQITIVASQKDLTYDLLQKNGFTYVPIGSYGRSFFKKLMSLPILDLKMYLFCKKIDPDILIGIGSIRAAHASLLLKKPCISFEDTEHAKEQIRLYLPFTATVCTPSCYRDDLGPKQVRYNGYHELAYLHPNRFTPDPAVLNELGLTENDRFIIVRFVSWEASHDVGQHGIRDKVGLVKALEQYGRVLITSEGALPPELQPYQIRISPEKLHDLLYYATLYVGEGGTMASEAAVLGTPSIFISSLVGTMGNFIELEKTYDILYGFTDSSNALEKAIEILHDSKSKDKWKTKRERLLKEKIDATEFMIWLIENYPQSIIEMTEHSEAQPDFNT